jgi:hypothetical protein
MTIRRKVITLEPNSSVFRRRSVAHAILQPGERTSGQVSDLVGRPFGLDLRACATVPRMKPMVNPMEIMPVLALAFMIVCIPILGDRP